MNLNQKREMILRSARQEIARYGITAFRVEEIARIRVMSKRTIYRIFPTKSDLLRDCILWMGLQVKGKIALFLKGEQEDPMKAVLELLEEYINDLYNVEGIFLKELKQSVEHKKVYLEIRERWYDALTKLLEKCEQKGYILADIQFFPVSERLLTTLFESRVEEEPPRVQQMLFCRTVLRGIATQTGMIAMEEKHSDFSTENESCYS